MSVRRRRPNPDEEERTPGGEVERDVIWLWSTPRSGAELLLQLLSHPLRPDPQATLSFRPPPARAKVAPHVTPIDELRFGAHVAPWPGEAIEVGGAWMPGTLLNLCEQHDPYLLSRISEPVWREPLRGLALTRIGAARERAVEHVRGIEADSPIVVKEVTTTHAADRVMDLMPRSRMIVVVRDPRDVVHSRLEIPETFDEEVEPLRGDDRAEELRRVAQLWAMSVDVCAKASAAHDPERSARIRFEDLLADPAAALAHAFAVVGAERDADAIAEAVELSSVGDHPPDREPLERDLDTAPGAWREGLTDAEVRTVEQIAGPRLEALGYEPA
ncbi:MAG: sulfotransferase [Solirubrobacterales bacterium]